jgi:hypothetical protein
MGQKTSIWERLRMAYRALTQDYYVFFGFDKDTIIWNKNDTYKELNRKKLSQFSYIPYNIKMMAYGKETNIHDFLWNVIENFAKEAQNGKF